jgi:hypothetical protein
MHVSAQEFHLQGIYEHKVSQVQLSTSDINLPNCHLQYIKMLKFYIYIYTYKVDKYKPGGTPKGRVFDSRWCHFNFSLT